MTVALTQPFAEQLRSSITRWKSISGLVHFWTSSDLLFGVFFSADKPSAISIREQVEQTSRGATVVTMDASTQPVPVYFDFEHGWVRVANLTGTSSYPVSLPRTLRGLNPSTLPSPGQGLQGLRTLVESPFISPAGLAPGGRAPPALSESVARRIMRAGWAEPRCFLDPLAVARTVSGFPGQVAFVWGNLVGGRGPDEPFRALVQECDIGPFLYVHEKKRVFFATLAGWHPSETPLASQRLRRPPLTVLGEHLCDIASIRVPIEELECIVNHRYDRLFEFEEPDG